VIDLPAIVERLRADLEAQSVDFALVGALAVSVRTEPRFTRDVDAAVAVIDDAQAQRVIAGLAARGWQPDSIIEQEATGRLAAVRLAPPGESAPGRVVDLLFASSGIEAELVDAAEYIEILPGLNVRVARIAHLIVLKVLSESPARPQDRVDLAALIAAADPDELQLAREAAELVERRGYARGRELVKAVDRATNGR
jgi:predicted nucleotidyltransferase